MAKHKRIKQYYVGARHISYAIEIGKNDEWTHATEAEAIKHAQQTMEDEDYDSAIVVKIVAVVRRKKVEPPVTVQRLR